LQVLDAAIFKTAIALCELLGDAVSFESGGEDLEQRIAKLFKKVNINNDGEITFDEFQRAIVDTDIFVQEEMLTMTFHTFDLDLNQCLNLEEFSDMCTNLLEVRAKKQKEASAKKKKK
jgi:Ca2+-binding EF-hand superfamily protein